MRSIFSYSGGLVPLMPYLIQDPSSVTMLIRLIWADSLTILSLREQMAGYEISSWHCDFPWIEVYRLNYWMDVSSHDNLVSWQCDEQVSTVPFFCRGEELHYCKRRDLVEPERRSNKRADISLSQPSSLKLCLRYCLL